MRWSSPGSVRSAARGRSARRSAGLPRRAARGRGGGLPALRHAGGSLGAAATGAVRECRGRRLGFDAAIALGPYQGPIRDLCLRLKHERNAWLARWLVDLLVEARGRGSAGCREDAWVVPVPLHWRRRWQRGYNQADELARRLAKRLALRRVRALRRVVATDPLAGSGRAERARLMRDAFRVRPGRIRRWQGGRSSWSMTS